MKIYEFTRIILSVWWAMVLISLFETVGNIITSIKKFNWYLFLEFMLWVLLGITIWVGKIYFHSVGFEFNQFIQLLTVLLYFSIFVVWYFLTFTRIGKTEKYLVSFCVVLTLSSIILIFDTFLSVMVIYGMLIFGTSFVISNL